jgi:hypothetical protein
MLNGAGPYFYEVRSVRDGEQVRQEIIKYWGLTNPKEHHVIRTSPMGIEYRRKMRAKFKKK